ncbi:hypothetical protein ACOMHN_016234 [Nucella lapillus]
MALTDTKYKNITTKDDYNDDDTTSDCDRKDIGNNASHDDILPTREGIDDSAKLPDVLPQQDKVQVYWRRWLMLFLFCTYSFSNAVQWIHLNIIANVLEKYYNSSLPSDPYQRSNAIDWLSMVFMLVYVPLIFPATWLLDKKGLRLCNVTGCFLNCLAAWLKCASVGEDLFGVLMFAQTVAAISQLWVLGIPARLAAVWFGPNEVSTATSLGVFGNQMGIAVGFLTPPAIVRYVSSLEDIGTNLRNMFFGTAAVTTAIFIANLFLFQKEPPTPPSRAQQHQLELEVNADYGKSLLNLFRNKGFVILMISYGMNTGSFYAVSTLLNNIILDYFPVSKNLLSRYDNDDDTMVNVILMWGTSLGIYLMTTASMAAFAFTLSLNRLWVVFLTGGLLGLTMTGYLPVGFEFAAELTFPESEGTSSGLLNASAQVLGIALTMAMRVTMVQASTLWANVTLVIVLLAGSIMTGEGVTHRSEVTCTGRWLVGYGLEIAIGERKVLWCQVRGHQRSEVTTCVGARTEVTKDQRSPTGVGVFGSAELLPQELGIAMRVPMVHVFVLWPCVTLVIVLVAGFIMTGFIRADYRRQAAGEKIVSSVTDIEMNVAAGK